jgi:ATP-dependent Clp protease ATP-binding subunit ClpA
MSQVIDFTQRVADAIQRPDDICRRHGQTTVGTEHLLMALAEDEQGIAGQVVDQLGGRQRCLDMLEEIMTSDGYNRESRPGEEK